MTKALVKLECNLWFRLLVVMIGIYGFGTLLAASGLWAIAALTDPVRIERVESVNSPIAEGDALVVRVYRDKRRWCPVTSFRYATDSNGRAFDIPDRTWPGASVGTAYADVEYDTTQLPPGRYTLHVHLLYHCAERDIYLAQPSVNFQVTP